MLPESVKRTAHRCLCRNASLGRTAASELAQATVSCGATHALSPGSLSGACSSVGLTLQARSGSIRLSDQPMGGLRSPALPFDQQRIAELVGAIESLAGCGANAVEQAVGGEGAQELVVAFAGLVDAGENRIDDAKRRAPRDASAGQARSRPHGSADGRSRFEGPYNARPDRYDAAMVPLASWTADAHASEMR